MNTKAIIQKYKELVEHYHNYYLPIHSIHCNKGILAIKRTTKKLKIELSLLQEQEDIDTPLKNMTKNAFTMTDKIEEQGGEKEPDICDRCVFKVNYDKFREAKIAFQSVTPSGKELREEPNKADLIEFMVWYKNYVPIGTMDSSQTIVSNYLKSNQ